MSFEQDISRWTNKAERRMDAAFKTAVQNLVEESQTPRARGGRMPVDTSFLRNSGQAALNSVPSGGSSPSNMDSVPLVISRAQPGDRIVFGWTAQYARAMENRYAFMRSAAQNWNKIAFQAVKEAERRIR